MGVDILIHIINLKKLIIYLLNHLTTKKQNGYLIFQQIRPISIFLRLIELRLKVHADN